MATVKRNERDTGGSNTGTSSNFHMAYRRDPRAKWVPNSHVRKPTSPVATDVRTPVLGPLTLPNTGTASTTKTTTSLPTKAPTSYANTLPQAKLQQGMANITSQLPKAPKKPKSAGAPFSPSKQAMANALAQFRKKKGMGGGSYP